MNTEEPIWICSSQLEGADGPDRREKVHHDKEVRRAASQGEPVMRARYLPCAVLVHKNSSSLSIYTQVEEDRHMHMQNANQVAPAALARAGVCTTGIVASKFWIDSEDRAR